MPIPTNKPFKLEAFWCSHPEFHNIVQQSWHHNDLIQATSYFQENVTTWSKDTFGNIFQKKKRILTRLEGIQNS